MVRPNKYVSTGASSNLAVGLMGYVLGDYTLEEAQNAVGSGWKNLVTLAWLLCKYQDPPRQVQQVKEKWGGLRIYISSGPPSMFKLLGEIENLSYKICESCGKPGKPRQTGWVKTRCDKCQTEWEVDRPVGVRPK